MHNLENIEYIKNIKLPLFNYVPLTKKDIAIIDTPLFQRLRNIHQNSLTYFTYPSANSTRFEHTLGVLYLGERVLKNTMENSPQFWGSLSVDKMGQLFSTFRVACLLHDIGHLPFSHVSEDFVPKQKIIDKLKKNGVDIKDMEKSAPHELLSCLIVMTYFKDILEKEFGIEPEKVCGVILGKVNTDWENAKYLNVLAGILNSQIDVDKLEYILRDSYTSGAVLTGIDVERMIMSYIVYKDKLSLNGKSLSVILNFINGREALYLWMYQHHTVIFANSVMREIINRLPIDKDYFFSDDGILKPKDGIPVDDIVLLNEIRKQKDTEPIKYLYDFLEKRDFLKSCWKNPIDFKRIFYDKKIAEGIISLYVKDNPSVLKQKIESDLSIKPEEVLVSFSSFTPFTPVEYDIIIVMDVKKDITCALTNLFPRMQEMGCYSKIPYVFTTKENKEKVLDYLTKIAS